jgi:hypothetical protein
MPNVKCRLLFDLTKTSFVKNPNHMQIWSSAAKIVSVNTPQPSAAEAPASRFASPLLPIFLIVVVDILGFTIILPLLPFYAERLGATPTVVGALVAVYAVCQLISGPILGQLSDRFGRRPYS